MKKVVSKMKRALHLRSSTLDSRAKVVDSATHPGCADQAPIREDSRKQFVFCDPPQYALPEALPPEIRYHIMSMLDLHGLEALVHASSVYYRQYSIDRKRLLAKCLATTLQSVALDAYLVYESGSIKFSRSRNPEAVTKLLGFYEGRRALSEYPLMSEELTTDEVSSMATFHLSLIQPLVQRYTVWALSNLAHEPEGLQSDASLSTTEELRILRSMYRFQLCCNLFGVGCHGTPFSPRSDFDSVGILRFFLSIFEPWEVEEIACIYAFAKERYDEVFDDIRWDVHEENPKFDGQRPPTPDGAFDFDNSWIRHCLLIGTISRGLKLLHTVLFKIENHEHLVSTMQDRIAWPAGSFLEGEALGETAQIMRRNRHPSPRDSKEERRDPLPFQGDGLHDVHPPLAWTLIWRGTYSNLFGHYMEDSMRRWGYVMWDAARLERSGGKDVLKRQWKATTISSLKDPSASSTLWYRIHVLIFDLQNFNTPSSNKRLEKVVDPSFVGKPYFSPEEADKIKQTVVDANGKTFSQMVEEALNERLERRQKKRVESGDFRVCAAHDLAPIMGRALGIDLKQMEKDKEFATLAETKGLWLGGETWGGLKKKSFSPKKKRR
ncbi:uncharacterized protein BO80DRAFT_469240 [Aspergillus ibericus CBS 121593]|uniref:Uncharacterized protein n=1 Tax=Aspergillus ibericus CBS 121593 TaxID=1448316 RepID=A0A395GNN1_9EURO|nr:hypothetical protein BO80DRAFT_469240 [Aspergillus ibericus CBS 121593]RAK95623.1 hypothetical protein BO80DRAFT_469240 [Aspergillus ibericus CBS 121593]